MARKEADLSCCGITQELQSEYWDWTDEERKAIENHDTREIAQIIKTRLENGGCSVSEMYAIIHDKDTRMKWDESVSQYVIEGKAPHIHCVVKFKKGTTLSNIASMVGVAPEFIEKAGKGKYAYDNMLAYLIHIKYPDKYQYDSHAVITICGSPYTKIYCDHKMEWEKGRAKVQSQKHEADIDWLEDKILTGQVTLRQVMLTDEYFNIYSRNKRRCEDAFDTYSTRKIYKTIQAMENEEFKLTVFFFTGEPGAGKTRMSKELISELIRKSAENGDPWSVYSAAASNSMDNYRGEEIVFMDDLRGVAMSSSDWLKLLDAHNINSASARYYNKIAACRVLIITSTKSPIEFFYYCKQMGGGDRSEALDQFMRRIQSRVHVIEADNYDYTKVMIANCKKGEPQYKVVPHTYPQETVTLKYNFPDAYTMFKDDAIEDLIEKVMFNNRPRYERECLEDVQAEEEDIRRSIAQARLEDAEASIA